MSALTESDGRRSSFSTTWRVRSYELDANGHVNNSVYVAYAEEVATLHAEALGFGLAWAKEQAGTWVVRRHEITYALPAMYGDELTLTTEVEHLRGARAVRHTVIRLAEAGSLVADIRTEWVWIRLSDRRPGRIPESLVAAFGDV
jgi:acyl-CoA thioester hydrolase